MLEKVRHVGWLSVEIGMILVSLALLLNIILGKQGGPAVNAIADNAMAFLQGLPAGTIVGLAALWVIYLLVRSRFKA